MPEADKPPPETSWVERLRSYVDNHALMKDHRLPSIGRELARAVEDIRHKVVEEGFFGRQVTDTGFNTGIHGAPSTPGTPTGSDVHGNGDPAGGTGLATIHGSREIEPLRGEVTRMERPDPDRETLRQEFLEACRALARPQLGNDRGPEQGRDLGPAR